jgi:putative FmdB family regulatory protein
MPIYEYECTKCEVVREELQKMSDAPLSICPDCGGPVSKVFSKSSFALKGTGFYSTDYKKPQAQSTSSTSSSTTPTSSAPSSTPPAPATKQVATPSATPTKKP